MCPQQSPALGTKMTTRPQAIILHLFPVHLADDSFRPLVADFVSIGAREEEDSMSFLASEKDWAESEPDRSEAEGPTDLHDQFTRVLAKAVKEFDLNWDAPEETSQE